MPTVDVIVPVYRNLEAVRRCIESVLGATCRTPHELVLVNDGTPEPELARYLRDLGERGLATLIEQPSRQGYAAAVNQAFQAFDGHVPERRRCRIGNHAGRWAQIAVGYVHWAGSFRALSL